MKICKVNSWNESTYYVHYIKDKLKMRKFVYYISEVMKMNNFKILFCDNQQILHLRYVYIEEDISITIYDKKICKT